VKRVNQNAQRNLKLLKEKVDFIGQDQLKVPYDESADIDDADS
jgi:hypothetical protein